MNTDSGASMKPMKRKAFAYVTHGRRLLLFTHPDHPEAGVQVPAGTVENGETPEAAVLREAREETGREDLELVRFLGETTRDMADFDRNEVHHRSFFHMRCTGDPPETWRTYELVPAEGGDTPLFEFFWADLPDSVPEMIAGHGALLGRLVEMMHDA